jgi:hypothetical protein
MDVANRVADYKKRAEEARREAARMTSAAAREGLRRVAAEWDLLADDILRESGLQSGGSS